MFFEDGWVPLSEITGEVLRRLQALRAKAPAGETQTKGLSQDLAISVWDICDAAPKIGVTGPDGAVIPASKDLVAWADPMALSNEHVDLRQGNVGSSSLPDADGHLPDPAELAARYGTFLHLPIVMPINAFQSSLTFLEDELAAQKTRDEAVIEVARAIVARLDSGALLTRDIARREIGAAISRRKFKLAWAIAAQNRPALSAPARWVGL